MATGLPSRMRRRSPTVGELLSDGRRSFSFEFFPPADDAGERTLWRAIRELEALRPTFVSVTYGAGGSTRDRTVRVTERIAAETTLTPMGHLTCVGHSKDELRDAVGHYADAGVRTILALRGDPPGGPGQPWRARADGLDHAAELVALVRSLGDFSVGVAAFPEGHPEAVSVEADAAVLAEKAACGADFAVTQLFFRYADYAALVRRVRALGCTIPVIPGIMPILNLGQVTRMAQLSGADVPAEIVAELSALDDPAAVRRRGIELATELCRDLLDGGAPGLHFFTLNRSRATREIFSAVQDLARSGV